jgi:hypothetical protein
MTDFKIDKDEYPLDTIFVPDKEGGYLAEGRDKSKKYRPVSAEKNLIVASIYLEIEPSITYRFSAGEFSGSTFYGKAKMAGKEDSLSFFGTDREIGNIDIEIFAVDKGMQLQFRGDLSQKYNDYSIDDSEEYIFISFAIEHSQFERLFRLWEHNNIEKIVCSIKREQINGLYKLDSLSPCYEYKILSDKKIVKNYQEIPENFTDFKNSKTYYTSNDCFSLVVRKEKFSKKEKYFLANKDNFESKEEIDINIQENIVKLMISNLDEIKKYAYYIFIIIVVMLILILLK